MKAQYTILLICLGAALLVSGCRVESSSAIEADIARLEQDVKTSKARVSVLPSLEAEVRQLALENDNLEAQLQWLIVKHPWAMARMLTNLGYASGAASLTSAVSTASESVSP